MSANWKMNGWLSSDYFCQEGFPTTVKCRNSVTNYSCRAPKKLLATDLFSLTERKCWTLNKITHTNIHAMPCAFFFLFSYVFLFLAFIFFLFSSCLLLLLCFVPRLLIFIVGVDSFWFLIKWTAVSVPVSVYTWIQFLITPPAAQCNYSTSFSVSTPKVSSVLCQFVVVHPLLSWQFFKPSLF